MYTLAHPVDGEAVMRNILKATQLKNIAPGQKVSDGEGLIVGRNASGSLYFAYRYRFNGKQFDIGIGGRDMTLAEARAKRDEYANHLRNGDDPKKKRAHVEAVTRPSTPSELGTSLRVIFEEFFDRKKRDSIGSEKDKRNWRNSVYTYFESMLDMPIEIITPKLVAECLNTDGLWQSKNETMDRTRLKLHQTWNYAVAAEITDKASPFDLSVLKLLLPSVSTAEKHHESIDWPLIPDFYENLQQGLKSGIGSPTAIHAILMTLFTALRYANGAGMRWEWVQEGKGLVEIPASHMKSRVDGDPPFLVPIVGDMPELFEHRRLYNGLKHEGNAEASALLFPQEFTQRDGGEWRPVSDAALRNTLRKFNPDKEAPGATLHGLRSSFKEWATNNGVVFVEDEVSERCLAHRDGDMVRRAYLRSDMWGKRQDCMTAWADFIRGG